MFKFEPWPYFLIIFSSFFNFVFSVRVCHTKIYTKENQLIFNIDEKTQKQNWETQFFFYKRYLLIIFFCSCYFNVLINIILSSNNVKYFYTTLCQNKLKKEISLLRQHCKTVIYYNMSMLIVTFLQLSALGSRSFRVSCMFESMVDSW